MVASPGVYPKGGPRPTTSRAEQLLYRSLQEQLPEGWIAWHSLRVRGDRGWEGEGDFVVAVPNRGVLVLEVKGGAIEVRGGQWYQNGLLMKKVPRDQAHNFARLLKLKLEARGLLEQQVPRRAIVTVFPDTPFSEEPSEGAVEGACLGQQDLPTLGQELRDIAERLLPGAPPRDRKWLDGLHALWCETWTPTLKLGDRTRLREQELVALDARQLALLEGVAPNPRLLVRGGAGTGKTLVARELYERLVEPLKEQGREPLYLCSTSALAAGLRGWGIQNAWTVRELAARLLEQAGEKLQDGAHRSAWRSETWELAPLAAAADAVPKLDLRYGAVVVDEGQDLTDNDWELVQALAGSGILWIFADTGQSFWPDRGVPTNLVPASFALMERYRCPEPLARFADCYRYEPPPDRPSYPTAELMAHKAAEPEPPPARPSQEGLPPAARLAELKPLDELQVVQIPSASALPDKVALEIGKAISGGTSAWDIAVLSLAGQTRTKLGTASRIRDYAVVRADDPKADEHVVADTFLRFKGLERPWIIVTELSLATDRYAVRMHVALTRATVGCVVLATREEIEADPRLRAACR